MRFATLVSLVPIVTALAGGSLRAQEPVPQPKPVPVETRPVETRPVETRPVKPDAKPAPDAKATQDPQPLAVGQRPKRMLQLPDLDGTVHRSADYADQIVVVCFWSTKCPIMRGYEDRMAAIVREYGGQGVRFLMINSNESGQEIDDGPARGEDGKPLPPAEDAPKPYAKIRAYLAENELPYTVLVDHGSRVADEFLAKTTPDIYVFARDGVLTYRGAIDDDPQGRKGEDAKPYLRTVLDALVAGEKVEPSETPPVGCTIKRPRAQGTRRNAR
jgi:hypothetical protein